MITGETQLLGVIGYPVKHSMSPVIHNAAIANLGLDYVYLPFPIAPDSLELALEGLLAIGVAGFSVTIPHKEAILPLLSEISTIAQTVGAVNTVVRKDNKWLGTNTDVHGFISPLMKYDREWSKEIAVVLGNGGAARSVIVGLTELGVTQIHVLGQHPDKLRIFKRSWENSPLQVNIQVHEWQFLPRLISQASLLVNTTPVGMYPKVNESPVSIKEMTNLRSGVITYDLIYNPNPTQLLSQAIGMGGIPISGAEMLVQQGVVALKMWLQREMIPVDVMRQELCRQIG
ncbi:shikimate dehydrogenase [Richelia intracellularis]|uniref:shikimate dehydrogenase n=1 Tax=Richelia intracellularis TaxID=1164990 RepID=UPI0005C5B20E|nr:shikimate dehydrogenase [Richelia intracellularis]